MVTNDTLAPANTAKVLPADVRAKLVSYLARAIAARWQQQHSDQKDERPERLDHAAGRDVHVGEREHAERITDTR